MVIWPLACNTCWFPPDRLACKLRTQCIGMAFQIFRTARNMSLEFRISFKHLFTYCEYFTTICYVKIRVLCRPCKCVDIAFQFPLISSSWNITRCSVFLKYHQRFEKFLGITSHILSSNTEIYISVLIFPSKVAGVPTP